MGDANPSRGALYCASIRFKGQYIYIGFLLFIPFRGRNIVARKLCNIISCNVQHVGVKTLKNNNVQHMRLNKSHKHNNVQHMGVEK